MEKLRHQENEIIKLASRNRKLEDEIENIRESQTKYYVPMKKNKYQNYYTKKPFNSYFY